LRVTPKGKRVLIRVLQDPSKNAGYGQTDLIVIPENHEKQCKFFGEVLAVGNRCVGECDVGDYVIVDTYAQYLFSTNSDADGRLAIVPEKDISAIVSEMPDHIDIVPTEVRMLTEVV
jgi:co-chaperonin GroES (HSP10)